MNDPELTQVQEGEYTLSGELTFQSVPQVWRTGNRLFDGANKVSINLAAVSRADSAGLALLVDWTRWAQHHDATIQFVDIPAQMLAIARVSGLDSILPLVRSQT